MMEIYRLRSSYALLDGLNELENQEIFFASPEELNDPMEGFLNIYWQGDRIIWRNIFKYYLYNLSKLILQMPLIGHDYEFDINSINLNSNIATRFATSFDHYNVYCNASNEIINNNEVNKLITKLSEDNIKIFREDLKIIFMAIHLYAIKFISAQAVRYNIYDFFLYASSFPVDLNTYFSDVVNEIENNNGEFILLKKLKKNYNNLLNITIEKQFNKKKISNINFIINEYSASFVESLIQITYKNVFIVCFTKNFNNPTMWSYYADGHKGSCLIFSTSTPKYLNSYIRSLNDHVISVSKDDTSDFQDMKVSPVTYSNDYSEVNFFDISGNIVTGIFKECWLSEGGKKSYLYDRRYKNHNHWQDEYYDKAHSLFFQKSKSWNKEEEWRSIIMKPYYDGSIEERKLKYNFLNLKGIVFGIKTSEEDKLKIITIIKEKCKKNNITDFKFYQAFYNHNTGFIDRFELE